MASQKYSWLIAVVICVVASTISNFGLNLQKLALTMKATGSAKARYRLVCQWFFGTHWHWQVLRVNLIASSSRFWIHIFSQAASSPIFHFSKS
jgi:hypothetical protein